jgi:hypothetical protein
MCTTKGGVCGLPHTHRILRRAPFDEWHPRYFVGTRAHSENLGDWKYTGKKLARQAHIICQATCVQLKKSTAGTLRSPTSDVCERLALGVQWLEACTC